MNFTHQIVMSAIALVTLVLRGFEFTALYIRWDDKAYGSIVWFLLGFPTQHLLSDAHPTLMPRREKSRPTATI